MFQRELLKCLNMYKLKQVPEDFSVIEVNKLVLSQDGKYFYHKLKKRNLTTEEAISYVCKNFKIPRNRVGMAGIKDKKAITEQIISLPKEINVHAKQMSLECVGRGEKPISIGSHQRNKFDITVRNLSEDDLNVFENNMARLEKKKYYFLNLFDQQRFSSHNDEVGEYIVRGEFKKAVDLMLSGNGSQEERMRAYLKIHQNDYIGAIRELPKKVSLIYVHAFQARLWNCVAEKLKDDKNMIVPIIGFGTEFKGKKVKDAYSSLLNEKKLAARDFIIRKIPELSSEGGERELFAKIEDLSVKKIEGDELNSGMKKAQVCFSLGKGCYATIAIRSLFLNQNTKDAP